PWVLKILRRSFGGASALFDSLWATQRPPAAAAPPPEKAQPQGWRSLAPIQSSILTSEDGDGDWSDGDFPDEPDSSFVDVDTTDDDASANKQRALEWLHTGRR
ncbi:MAG: hypothetical protein M3Y56_05055, partial [Armatimonadota bacterium]|nr:hypothetical protein [Armatimonadota bacterium]